METHAYSDGLSPRDLKDQLHRLVATRRQSLWLICRYLADLADQGGYGYDDIFVYAWCELAMPLRRTRERIRVGRALRALPAIEASFVTGKIGFARVREIVRVATPETEHLWLEAARTLPRRLLEARVAEAGGRRAPTQDLDEDADESPTPDIDLGADEDVTVRLPAATWRRLHTVLEAAKAGGGCLLSDREAFELILAKAEVALGVGVRNLGDAVDDPTGTAVPNLGDADDDPTGTAVPNLGGADDDPMGAAVPARGDGDEDSGGTPEGDGRSELDGGRAVGYAPLRPGDPVGTWDGTAVPGWEETVASPQALQVLEHLRAHGESRVDDAARAAGVDGRGLAVALAELELAGHLERTSYGYRIVRCQAGED